MDEYKNIHEVAIYLRKSRDDTNNEEDALKKHEKDLTDFAKKYGWRYILYKEIGSSDSIDYRPEMVRLLKDVTNDMYDAVLVIDYDRLGRGDMEDQGRIKRVFRESKTLILTPNKVYDLANEDQELMTDVEGLFARYEYKMIKKRLQRGKKIGTKLGLWTNGKPPFPYIYIKQSKTLEIDEEKLKIYNYIKDTFLSGKPCFKISWDLNNMGIKSPGGKFWNDLTIYRLLISEVHLGRIIYGKTSGSGHKNRKVNLLVKKPRDEWIIKDGAHKSVKTLEEHSQILALLESRKKIPKRARSGTYPLSGILYCGKCGKPLSCIELHSGVYVRTCSRTNKFGKRCDNKSVKVEKIYKVLYNKLGKYQKELLNYIPKPHNQNNYQLILVAKQEELKELKNGLVRIDDLYVLGRINRNQLKERIENQNNLIRIKEDEMFQIKENIQYFQGLSKEEHLSCVEMIKKDWKHMESNPQKMNEYFKTIIEKIYYIRKEKITKLKIEYIHFH